MSDNWYEDDSDTRRSEGGKLREQLEQALQELKALKEERDTLRGEVASSRLSTIVAEKGYKPGLARRAVADGVTDAAGLEKWLADNADWLPDPVTNPGQPEAGGQENQVNEPDPEAVAEFQSFSQVSEQLDAAAQPAAASRFETAMRSLPADASADEVYQAFLQAGV